MDRLGVEKWLEDHGVKNYTINEDLSVVVNGDVDISFKDLECIPISFRNVSGKFNCGYNKLFTLEGCPVSVGGDFYCVNNKLTLLEGCPTSVAGNFYCYNNYLTSLDGFPIVEGIINCLNNKIGEFELFLYEYDTSEQVIQYYNGKNLNEKLQISLSEDVTVIKKQSKL